MLFAGCSREAKKNRYLSQGTKDFEAGAYDKAKIDYLKVLQLDQRNATAFARIGQIWLEEGAPLRAGAFLKKAEELAPADSANRLRLARVYVAIDQTPKAREQVLAVLQQSPTDTDALVLLSEIARTPEDIKGAEAALQKFPQKQTAPYQMATANLALRRNDIPAAQQAVSQAVALDPKSSEAHQAMAVLYLSQKNQKEAAKELKTAAELAPLRSKTRVTYAALLRQTEGDEAAKAFLKDLTAKAPDLLPAWTLLGGIAFAEKKYDEALAFLENVFSRDPLNIDTRLLQADILLAKKDTKKAITELEKLDHAFSGLPPAKYRLAQAYLLENKPAQAATALDEALARNPDYTEAILARAELNLRTGHAQPAATALEEFLKKKPDFRPAQVLLADAYRASRRFDDAANIFREQIKVAPNAPEPHLFLGLVQLQQNNVGEARKSFEKVLELAPDNLPAVDQLVDLDLKAKDFAAASQRVAKQLEKQPKAAASYLMQAKVQGAQAQWKEAEATLKKAIELDPHSGPAYEMLVRDYLATNRLPDAVREIEVVLTKAPQNQTALMTLATIRAEQKEYAKARDAYEKLLALNPTFIPALNNLSFIYAEHLNEPDKAYDLAQKARTLDPGNAAVTDTLGWAAFKRGDYQQALTFFQEGAGKLGDNPEVQYHLGMAYYMMGQADAARAAFQKVGEASGDAAYKTEAQKRLALLGNDSEASAAMPVGELQQMIEKEPNDLLVRLRLGQAYEREKDWAKAVDAYEAALKTNPKLASAALKLAQLYGGPAPNREKALSYAKTARSLSPNDPKVTAVLGRVAFENGDFTWSYNILQESARQLGSDPRVLHDLAWAAYALGKVDSAREAMERCLKASPAPETAEDANAFLSLTSLLDNPTALANARAEIDAKLKADSKYVPAIMAAAALDFRAGNSGPAIERYDTVLERFPDFALAQKQLALLYARDPARAEAAFDLATKAKKAFPSDPDLTRVLGQFNCLQQNYTRAIQLLQESARQKPLDADGLYYLGTAQLEANQKPAGRKSLEEALTLGLKDPLAAKARSALAANARP